MDECSVYVYTHVYSFTVLYSLAMQYILHVCTFGLE